MSHLRGGTRVIAAVALALGGCTVTPHASPTATGTPPPALTAAPTQSAVATAAPEWARFEGHGFSFTYPGSWREIGGYFHAGEHGPTLLAAVGTGAFELGCSSSSNGATCGEPRWLVEDDQVVLVYRFGAWLGPVAPQPTPSLSPEERWVDVGGRAAIVAEQAAAARWHFPGAPEYIEARWGPGWQDRDLLSVALSSWHWDYVDPTMQPTPGEPVGGGVGVLDVRPAGWSLLDGFESVEVEGFPGTTAQVYGPPGIDVPPLEGPNRIVLYETLGGNHAYLDERIKQAVRQGGHAIAGSFFGEPLSVWKVDQTGELLVGWDRGDFHDVLVANAADYTVEQLLIAAANVYPCCG